MGGRGGGMGVAVINKVLNNNVVLANHPSYGETVIIGKGIGFNRKREDEISLKMLIRCLY